MVDLAKISIPPPEFDLPHVGTINARPQSIGTLSWYIESLKSKKWRTSHGFFRTFLIEKCHPIDGDAKEYIKQVNSLSIKKLNEVAFAFTEIFQARTDNQFKASVNPNEVTPCSILETQFKKRAERLETTSSSMLDIINKQFKLKNFIEEFSIPEVERIAKMVQPTGLLSEIQKSLISPTTLNTGLMKPRILENLERYKSPFDSILRPHRGLSAASRLPTLGLTTTSSLILGQITKTHRLIDQINNQFRLIDNASISRTSNLKLGLIQQDFIAGLINRPGFAVSAVAGIERMASDAVVASILSKFNDEALYPSVAFNSALSILQELDEEVDVQHTSRLVNGVIKQIYAENHPSTKNEDLMILLQVVQIIISAIALYFTIYSNNPNDAQLLEPHKTKIQQKQKQALRALKDDPAEIRFVSGHWNLRTGPDVQSTILTTLNRDQLVSVIEIRGNWARIIVLSYAGEDSFEGWVHRDGLYAK